ncbi:hypothetical protein EAF04_007681 [Stromatinia cepivora]|nr:hypothetical protein EAF04_007681 [Stromatinia cepivora]
MIFFSRPPKLVYSSVKSFDCQAEEEKLDGNPTVIRRTGTTIRLNLWWAISFAFLLCLSIGSTWAVFFSARSFLSSKSTNDFGPQWQCANPSTRQEWRTLSDAEKTEYIAAVQCLTTKPSKVRNNGTLYDDFPWVHKSTSTSTHQSSPFLPWHRYYIQIYENALQDDCSYTGTLPYWDWSLDWEDFTRAPIWGPHNFGSNGNLDVEVSVGEGHCVTDGPFAGITAMFYDNEYHPHCLSRGFRSGTKMKELGKLVQPEVVKNIMSEDNFETFAHRMEHNAHRFVSQSIRGEFSKFTGPYDPVFFLHHTNLDRLWWSWQMMDPKHRVQAYDGKSNKDALRRASLEDTLDMGGLRRNLPIAEVMETTSGIFCYRY